MKIRIITIGNIKDKNLKSLVDKYLSRINHYIDIEIIILKESNLFKYPNDKQKKIQMKNEAELFKKILINSFNISLCIEGVKFKSEDLSKKIDDLCSKKSFKYINFIIGGSYGIHEDIKSNSNMLLSFSNMTFPHQLMQIILLEQIFRSFKIIKNEEYHK